MRPYLTRSAATALLCLLVGFAGIFAMCFGLEGIDRGEPAPGLTTLGFAGTIFGLLGFIVALDHSTRD